MEAFLFLALIVLFFCARSTVSMCSQTSVNQIMQKQWLIGVVLVGCLRVVYTWSLSRKLLNKRMHALNGNTRFICPICERSFSTLAGLSRHESSGIHSLKPKPSKNNSLLNYFPRKDRKPKQKKARKKYDISLPP